MAHSSEVKATADQETPLSAKRLSAIRHDLRTPFNQMIGYAEMVSEDAAENGAKQPALDVASAAHSLLEWITDSLAGDPAHITNARLEAFRGDAAKPIAILHGCIERLKVASAADTQLPDDTPGTLSAIDRAFSVLQQLIVDSTKWLSTDEAPALEASPIAETSSSPSDPRISSEPDTAQPAPSEAAIGEVETGAKTKSVILVVDDQPANRDLLAQRLTREGFAVEIAADGLSALRLLGERPVDLVLLDVLMPGMDGLEVLQRIKKSQHLKSIPVIMISALDEIERVVQCIESGAEDYLAKPFNPVLLRARIGVTLERKRLSDEDERQRSELSAAVTELAAERENVQRLLLNILPERVAADLQQGHSAPMYFEDTTICFTDFVGFTLSTENMAAEQVVDELHTYFTAFDRVMERYGLEKLKTIGDSYMFASGLPQRHPANPINAVLAAMELVEATRRLSERPDAPGWQLRIGLHTGPVIAGVVGIRKFAFDIWGDSVNFASRMESSGAPGCINISERTYARVKDFFRCEARGKVMTKDKREVDMFFVRSIQPGLMADGSFAAFRRRYNLYFSEEPKAMPEFVLAKGA